MKGSKTPWNCFCKIHFPFLTWLNSLGYVLICNDYIINIKQAILCFLGPFLVGWFANYKGRKPTFILSGVTAIIGFTILSTTRNIEMLYVGRLLGSFASSMISVTNVMYIGEIALVFFKFLRNLHKTNECVTFFYLNAVSCT